MIPGTYSKPKLALALPILRDLRRNASISLYNDALSELIELVGEVVTSHGDRVEITTTMED